MPPANAAPDVGSGIQEGGYPCGRRYCASAFCRCFFSLILSSPVDAQQWNDLEDALEGRELILRPTFEGRRKVYLAMNDDSVFALHRGDRLFPLRESELVVVTDADPEDDHIELELRSARLGEGRVDFYGPAPTSEAFELWLDELFEIATAEADFHRYVGNRRSQTLHVRGANHLPEVDDREEFVSEADAIDSGYRHCGVCFVPNPDVADYETERSLAMMSLQQVQSTYYPLFDDTLQARVEGIGRARARRLARSAKGVSVPVPSGRLR